MEDATAAAAVFAAALLEGRVVPGFAGRQDTMLGTYKHMVVMLGTYKHMVVVLGTYKHMVVMLGTYKHTWLC